MPKYTKNLELFKWNTEDEKDLNSQFNLEKTLNENFDKIDEAVTKIDEKTLDDERVELQHLNKNVTGNAYHLTKNGSYPNIEFKLANPLLAKEIHSVRWKFKIKRLGDSAAAGFYSPYGNASWSLNIGFTEPAINYNQTKLNEIVELETQNISFSSTSTQKVEFMALGFNQNATKNYEHIVYDVELYINDVRQDISLKESKYVVDESEDLKGFLASKKYVEEKKNEAIEHTDDEIARLENKTTYVDNIDESSFGNLYRLQNPVAWGGNIAFKLRETINIDTSITHKVRVKVKVKDCGERNFNASAFSLAFRGTHNSDYNYTYSSILIGNASVATMPIKEKFYEFENEVESWNFLRGGKTDSFVLTAGTSTYADDVYFADLELFIDDKRVYFDFLPEKSPAGAEEIKKESNYIATQDYVKDYVENYHKTEPDTEMILPFPNNIYVIQNNDGNGNNTNMKAGVPLFIDYLYWGENGKILYKNGLDRAYVGEKTNTQTEQLFNSKETLQFKSDVYNVADVEFNKISIKENTSNGKIRLLIIGDSVTAGAITDLQYWAVAREYFAKEDIDLNRTSDVMFLGSDKNRNLTGTYKNKDYNVQACACGISSTSLDWWMTEENQYNRFVYTDSEGNKHFSILKWLERLRNYDDDGNKLTLEDENIGTELTSSNINNMMVCTPNIIFLNHTHNGGSITQYEECIEAIRAELPDCKIIIGAGMPLIGTWHPELYENIDWLPQEPLSYRPNEYSNYMQSRIDSLKNWTKVERGEASANGKTYNNIYYMPLPVITPTVESYDYYEIDCGIKKMKQVTKLTQMVTAHPRNIST